MPVYSRLPQGSCHPRESNAPYLAMLVYEALAKGFWIQSCPSLTLAAMPRLVNPVCIDRCKNRSICINVCVKLSKDLYLFDFIFPLIFNACKFVFSRQQMLVYVVSASICWMKILKKNLDCVKESENVNEAIGCMHNPTSKQGWLERKRERGREAGTETERDRKCLTNIKKENTACLASILSMSWCTFKNPSNILVRLFIGMQWYAFI